MTIGPRLKDREWIRHAFFLTNSANLDDLDITNQFFSSAQLKFTDSSLGGNECINPIPQFTPAADPRVQPAFSQQYPDLHEFRNQGIHYSEAVDDNKQIINVRCGFAQFNSLTTFFTSFYHSQAGMMARTGRSNTLFYTIGRALGYVAVIQIFPYILLGMGVHALGWLAGRQVSKYYYLKPAMAPYWTAVTNIVNQLAVNEGLVQRAMTDEQKNAIGEEYVFSAEDLQNFASMMPDIFRQDGSIDVYAVANRAQRMARRRQRLIDEKIKNSGVDLETAFKQAYAVDVTNDASAVTLEARQKRWYESVYGEEKTTTKTDASGNPVTVVTATDMMPETPRDKEGNLDEGRIDRNFFMRYLNMLAADLDDGAEFATFRVESTGQVTTSFSNSTTQSDIASKINGMSSSSRSTNFSFASGNVFGGAVTAVTDAIKATVEGALDSVNLSGLVTLAGGAFVDIPEHWDSSSASFPSTSYTTKLISPYNNPISRMINIDIPLAMLLAMALPLSTGPQSFISPFLVEYYDRGHAQSRLAIVSDLSISRGTSNLGYTNEGKALAIDVTWTFKDLSSIMHMPISGGNTLNPSKAFFSDDNSFTDFLAVHAAMNLSDQIYSSNKLKIRLTQQMLQWRSFFSASHFAVVSANTMPGRLASAFFKGISR